MFRHGIGATVWTSRTRRFLERGRLLQSPNIVNVHRYEELIAGHTYLIEVRAVSATRWRAQIERLPGTVDIDDAVLRGHA